MGIGRDNELKRLLKRLRMKPPPVRRRFRFCLCRKTPGGDEANSMSYLALYRQWRPQSFGRVVGQEHITRTLQNALKQGSLSHAYLFCGPRGTGKTTVAKLLAKAVNCLRPEGTEPCNQCPICQKITEGSSVDVLEIDAASNRGIDEIRDLKEKVKYAPAEARRKVYIVDEVHMLTNEAFNALLKTLEEPPSHVLFIMATTEPHKVPVTILSRCQRFDFHRFSADQITGQLAEVAESLGVEAEPGALAAIARAAEGGMRDALSLFDQVCAYCGSRVTLTDVLSVLGAVPGQVLADLALGVAVRDFTAVLRLLGDLAVQGKDMRQLLRDLTGYFRALLLVALGAEGALEAALTAEEEQTARGVASKFSAAELASILKVLAESDGEMRWAPQPRLILEMALIKAIYREGEGLPPRPVSLPSAPSAAAPAPPLAPPPAPQKAAAPADAVITDLVITGGVTEKWPALLERVKAKKIRLHAFLQEGAPAGIDGNQLTVVFNSKYRFHRDQVADPANRTLIEKAAEEVFGCPLRLNFVLEEAPKADSNKEALREHPEIKKILEAFDGEIIEIKEE